MAAAYFQQGKYDEALRWTTRVLVQVPDHLLGLLTAAIANAPWQETSIELEPLRQNSSK